MIIDAHCHLGRSPQFHFPDVSVGTMLAVMDRLGIERAVCCHLAMLQGAWELGFEESRGRVSRVGRQDRVLCRLRSDACRRTGTRRAVPRPGGVRGHQDPSVTARVLRRRRALRSGLAVGRPASELPILTHSWDMSPQNPAQKYSFPSRFETYAARYPEVTLDPRARGRALSRAHGRGGIWHDAARMCCSTRPAIATRWD